MKLKGTLKEWNDEKGYGFITPSTGGLDVFAHISAFQNRSRRPNPGEVVIYHPEKSESGKHRAVSVSYCSEKMRTWAPQKIGLGLWIALPASFAFLIAIWILYSMDRILWELAALYFVASIIAFILYWDDKYAARKGYWRTTEKSLLFCGLIGGWPGALIAQQFFRHKSSKTKFQILFWCSVIINCAGLIWILMPD